MATLVTRIPRKAELPNDFGHHKHRCKRCGAYLCRYHDPRADGGLCWPCAPGGEGGVVIEVEPGEYRRFYLTDDAHALRLAAAAHRYCRELEGSRS